jgi:hypothetical protein
VGDPGRLADEVAGSKREIEDRLGAPCRYFSWPFGQLKDFDRRALDAVVAAGYEACFGAYRAGIYPGAPSSAFLVPRHHFEAHWPIDHVLYFAKGGREGRPLLEHGG